MFNAIKNLFHDYEAEVAELKHRIQKKQEDLESRNALYTKVVEDNHKQAAEVTRLTDRLVELKNSNNAYKGANSRLSNTVERMKEEYKSLYEELHLEPETDFEDE